MKAFLVDVLILIDTRCNEFHCKRYRDIAAAQLGAGAFIGYAPSGSDSDRALVGGQLILTNCHWGRAQYRFWKDDSGLGLITDTFFKINGFDLKITATYWPCPSSHKDAVDSHYSAKLWDRATSWLHKSHRNDANILEFIKSTISTRVADHLQKPNSAAVVCGDLNGGWFPADGGIHKSVASWATGSHLQNPRQLAPSEELRRAQCTFQRNQVGISHIDHILLTPNRSIAARRITTVTDLVWAPLSDHRPVLLDLSITNIDTNSLRYRSPLTNWKQPVVDLDISNWKRGPNVPADAPVPKHITKFQDTISRKLARHEVITSPQQASDRLLFIVNTTVAAAKLVQPKKRGRDGWSPEFMALKSEEMAIIEIQAFYSNSNRILTSARTRAINVNIIQSIDRWERKVATLLPDRIEASAFLGLRPAVWRSIPHHNIYTFSIAELKRVRANMHGKSRSAMRLRSKANVRRIERLRLQGRWGRIIKTITSSQSTPFTLETLKIDGSITANPFQIHQVATNWFNKEWFGNKPLLNYGFHKPGADVTRLTSDFEFFKSEHACTKIPEHLLLTIWQSINSTNPKLDSQSAGSNLTIRERMKCAISASPTRAEFDSCLASTSNTTMGGISQLTYSMMKAWPEATKDEVFSILRDMWPDKYTPDWWKWRWMCPKPKVTENIGLGDLRPLVLVEVLRKLWTNIIVCRIKDIWGKVDLLSQNQHAFRARHGTDTATIQLINALEEARECASDLYISSWDMKRAFDSVAKTS